MAAKPSTEQIIVLDSDEENLPSTSTGIRHHPPPATPARAKRTRLAKRPANHDPEEVVKKMKQACKEAVEVIDARSRSCQALEDELQQHKQQVAAMEWNAKATFDKLQSTSNDLRVSEEKVGALETQNNQLTTRVTELETQLQVLRDGNRYHCPVCYEEILQGDTPLKILQACGHVYCQPCLDHLRRGSAVKCPLCDRRSSYFKCQQVFML